MLLFGLKRNSYFQTAFDTNSSVEGPGVDGELPIPFPGPIFSQIPLSRPIPTSRIKKNPTISALFSEVDHNATVFYIFESFLGEATVTVLTVKTATDRGSNKHND